MKFTMKLCHYLKKKIIASEDAFFISTYKLVQPLISTISGDTPKVP
jgi:hypothetical protein